jgi:type II secretory pathway pseudopilin PulG
LNPSPASAKILAVREKRKKARPLLGEPKGFTILELGLGLAAVGLLLTLWIPLYEKAKNTATLRATMAEMQMWARGISDYIEDFGLAPTNPNGKISYKKPIVREMLPYLERVRTTDWWGFSYRIWTGKGIDKCGIRTTGAQDFIILSVGKEGIPENWTFDPNEPQAGFYEIRNIEDFEKDLILWDGRFVRCPRESK